MPVVVGGAASGDSMNNNNSSSSSSSRDDDDDENNNDDNGGGGGDNNDINNNGDDSNDNESQEPCTVSFVDTDGHDSLSHTPQKQLATSSLADRQRQLLLLQDELTNGIGLGSFGLAVAMAFASGSFSTSPYCSSPASSSPPSTCYDDGCMDTDWLLVGSLAYQCYFFWTAARHGIRDFIF